MDTLQAVNQLKALLIARKFNGDPTAKPVFGSVIISQALTKDAYPLLKFPFVMIRIGSSANDDEEPAWITQQVNILLGVNVEGDAMGQNVMIGANVEAKSPQGRGLLEIQRDLLAVARFLNDVVGIRVVSRGKSSVAVTEDEDFGTINSREYAFDLKCTDYPELFFISGSVGISGVTVTAGGISTTSGVGGAYTITGLDSGTYTVTPTFSGHTFTPATQSVTIGTSNVTGINFTISPSVKILTIESSPDDGATITVSPNDIYGDGSDDTPFVRLYDTGTTVSLTAPATYSGNNFSEWLKNGVHYSSNVGITLTISGNDTMQAVYVLPPPAPPVTDGLVGWWKGEDNADDSYSTNDGTFPAANYVAAHIGKGFNVPNVPANGVNLPSSPLNLTSISISAWIKSSVAVAIVKGYSYELGTSGGNLFGWIRTVAGDIDVTGITPILDDNWHHVVVTYDENTGVLNLYVDNALDNTGTFATSPIASSINDVVIFSNGSAIVDEVFIFNKAISPADITALYNQV